MIGHEEIRQAFNELSHGGIKLYMYLVENVDEYNFWLSPKDVMSKYHMSKSTYDRAKAELINRGYIVQEGKEIHFYANKEDAVGNLDKLKEKINITLGRLKAEGYNTTSFEKDCTEIKNTEDNILKRKLMKVLLEKAEIELDKIYSKKDFL